MRRDKETKKGENRSVSGVEKSSKSDRCRGSNNSIESSDSNEEISKKSFIILKFLVELVVFFRGVKKVTENRMYNHEYSACVARVAPNSY